MTPHIRFHPLTIATTLVVGLLCGALAGLANAGTVLTSATGNVTTGERQLAQNDTLSSSDTIEVEGNGNASVLVGDTAIVRMCNGASLGFGNDRGDGPSALNLRSGQAKVSAGKRATDDPLEIHTPAAIATLLGTEAHVAVDPDTGDTTITSLAHQIRVTGTGEGAGEGVVISEGQSVTVATGGEPGAVESANVASLALNSQCLDDARYRIAAVKAATREYTDGSVQMIAMMDSEADVPQVAAGPPIIPTGTLGPPAILASCLTAAQCTGSGPETTEFIPSDPVIIGPPPPGPGGPPVP